MLYAIIGSRSFSDYTFFKEMLDFSFYTISSIISGGARGADELAARYAAEKDIPIREILPEYKVYGKKAPLVRNIEIINKAEAVIAFWDMISKGTGSAIKMAKKRGIPVYIIEV